MQIHSMLLNEKRIFLNMSKGRISHGFITEIKFLQKVRDRESGNNGVIMSIRATLN